MKRILTVILLLLNLGLIAQNEGNKNIKVVMDHEPAYPKGEQALYDEVVSLINYSDEAKQKKVNGEVTLSFDIRSDSTVSNAKILSGVGAGVDEAVRSYVEKLKFSPAMQNGKPVKMNVMYSFPVNATLK
ncbi:MAG: outer rane transport energization protein TonB [Bacteroidota bacterium]|jgi:protein TonB|nr:outer rane transport energization protein TonB [Bacteroidota bacterium]